MSRVTLQQITYETLKVLTLPRMYNAVAFLETSETFKYNAEALSHSRRISNDHKTCCACQEKPFLEATSI